MTEEEKLDRRAKMKRLILESDEREKNMSPEERDLLHKARKQ
jgi:hypothetical protein